MRSLIMLFAITLIPGCQPAEPSIIPSVVTGLERTIERGGARAIAIGLYDNGKTSVTGFGRLSREDSSTPTSETVFEIGSITKVFTSLLTQVQIDAGRLDWDDTIGQRLPGTTFASEQVAAITLRELATHTSGLPRIPDNMDMSDPMNPYAGYERWHLLTFISGFDPEALIKEYVYSNLAVGLLGEIAADAAGIQYGQAMYRDVLQPLGMNDTGNQLRESQANRLAKGFSEGADMPNWDGFDALAGAGALLSSIGDMLTFVSANLDPDSLQEQLDAIRVPQATGETAIGWHILNTDDGQPVFWHNGGTGGYASFLAIRPDTGTGVVILSTSTDYNAITELGFDQISGKVSDLAVPEIEAYPGTYQIAEGFVLSVFIEDDQLFAQATGQGAFRLTPSAENEFVYAAANIRIVFDIGDDGRAASLTLFQSGQETPAPRISDDQGPQARTEIAVDATLLDDYVGKYELAPSVIISVMTQNSQLYAQLTGQAAYPVFAYEQDRFFYKVVDAQLQFERDENGDVVAVVLHQVGEQRAPRVE